MRQPTVLVCAWTSSIAVFWLMAGPALAQAKRVSFRNDVMPILSKAGCNAGTCHGNKNGKAGFKLSLRGQDAELDWIALTRDAFGRRSNPFEPDKSLLLLKPTGQLPHEGGQRFRKDSEEYQILRGWIEEGCASDPPGTSSLKKIEVTPTEQVLVEPVDRVQLRVWATFSDGARCDVTRRAVYDPANTGVTVSYDGEVRRERPGEATVLVRFLQCQEPVRLAFVATRPGFQWHDVPVKNYIDQQVLAKLRTLRINPSALCDDTTFLRRAYLDLLGLLPTAAEARAFVAEKQRNKRARLIDRLLERPEFADFWALKWADLLRNEEKVLDKKGVQLFQHWIRQSIADHKPLDQFVHELIAARGSTYQNPAANYYRALRDPVKRAESTAQLFLGVRLQCAQCHNHPYDRWTQDDYYDWADVFARVQYKVIENNRRDGLDTHEFIGEQIVFMGRTGDVTNVRSGKPADARFLGVPDDARRHTHPASSITHHDGDPDRLEDLAAWLTSPNNPLFARAQVNRIWSYLMGRGLVDPVDDFRPTNPPSHPALLEALARDFVEHKFDLRYLVRLIMNSRIYQLSAEPTETNQEDEINYSHAGPRRLSAEQMLDAQMQVLGVPAKFGGYPSGMRAVQLPVGSPVRRGELKAASAEQFLATFGKPARLLTCECERSTETTMGQAFQLISGPTLHRMLTQSDNQLGRLLASGKSNTDMVQELYWSALSRPPRGDELSGAVRHIDRSTDRRQALEDLTWALLNAKEFVLRR